MRGHTNLPKVVDGVAKGTLGCYVARMMRIDINLQERKQNTVEPPSMTQGMKY